MIVYRNRYARERAREAAKETRRVRQLAPVLMAGLGCPKKCVWVLGDPQPPHVHLCTYGDPIGGPHENSCSHRCSCGFSWTAV